jgi:hypothetical protein
MLNFILKWRDTLNIELLQGKQPKTLIVNEEDLCEYEQYLSKVYPNGIMPIYGGVLRYKMIPLGISKELKRGEVALEWSK